jgi:type VI secretion system protein ImpC
MAEKGFLGGSMKFQVNEDDDSPAEVSEGPILPLRVLVVTALTPNADSNAGADAPERPIRLDPTEPAAIFNKVRPRIALEIPNVLVGGQPTKIELAPSGLKSFRPDGLVEEVAMLRSLLDGKLVLDRLRAGELTEDQAQGQLDRLWGSASLASEVLGRAPRAAAPIATASAPAAPAASPASSSGSALDSILDMVDVPGAQAAAAPEAPSYGENQSKIASIISQVALGGRAKVGRGKTGIPLVEEALGAQIGAILQHPEVRRLERAYRSLTFLLERMNRIPGVILEVVGIGESGAAASLARVLKGADPPYSFAIADVDVDGTARSLAELEAIAEVAEGFTCPVFVNATEQLLGVGDLSRVDKLDSKMNLFTAPHRAPWRSTAHKQSLRWVALVTNGTLARQPYDKQSSRVREATIKEIPGDHEAFVWMAPAYALGVVCLNSFKETGWPARITGARHGTIENLPVREVEDDGAPVAIPTQAFISTDSQRELSRIGILALASAPNSDAAYVHTAPTAYVQPDKKTYDSATTQAEDRPPAISLVDQLFVARLVQFARSLSSKIPPDSDPNEAKQVLEAATWALFDKAPPAGPEISVNVARGGDGLVAQFSVRPRRFLGVSLDELGFEMPIG